MATTQPVNFRANSEFYKRTKDALIDTNITISDILNATLRKVANGAIDINEFINNDSYEQDNMIAFEELKREILIGHKAIQEGRVTSLQDVRKEFGLE